MIPAVAQVAAVFPGHEDVAPITRLKGVQVLYHHHGLRGSKEQVGKLKINPAAELEGKATALDVECRRPDEDAVSYGAVRVPEPATHERQDAFRRLVGSQGGRCSFIITGHHAEVDHLRRGDRGHG